MHFGTDIVHNYAYIQIWPFLTRSTKRANARAARFLIVENPCPPILNKCTV